MIAALNAGPWLKEMKLDWKMKLEFWILCFREIECEIGVLQVIAPWSDHQNIGSDSSWDI